MKTQDYKITEVKALEQQVVVKYSRSNASVVLRHKTPRRFWRHAAPRDISHSRQRSGYSCCFIPIVHEWNAVIGIRA